MGENERKILDMLAAGKISVDEAQRLLSLIGAEKNDSPAGESPRASGKPAPKYLYVVVEPKPGAPPRPRPRFGPPEPPTPPGVGGGHDYNARVHIRVPFSLVRAGMKFTSLMPSDVSDKVNQAMKDKGINFDMRHVKYEDIEELIGALCDSEINVDSDYETVRVYAE
jgi:hypothetical protein